MPAPVARPAWQWVEGLGSPSRSLVRRGRKQTGSGKEALLSAVVEREHAATPRHDVDDQLRVLPGLELCGADIDRDACDLPELDVVISDNEVPAG